MAPRQQKQKQQRQQQNGGQSQAGPSSRPMVNNVPHIGHQGQFVYNALPLYYEAPIFHDRPESYEARHGLPQYGQQGFSEFPLLPPPPTHNNPPSPLVHQQQQQQSQEWQRPQQIAAAPPPSQASIGIPVVYYPPQVDEWQHSQQHPTVLPTLSAPVQAHASNHAQQVHEWQHSQQHYHTVPHLPTSSQAHAASTVVPVQFPSPHWQVVPQAVPQHLNVGFGQPAGPVPQTASTDYDATWVNYLTQLALQRDAGAMAATAVGRSLVPDGHGGAAANAVEITQEPDASSPSPPSYRAGGKIMTFDSPKGADGSGQKIEQPLPALAAVTPHIIGSGLNSFQVTLDGPASSQGKRKRAPARAKADTKDDDAPPPAKKSRAATSKAKKNPGTVEANSSASAVAGPSSSTVVIPSAPKKMTQARAPRKKKDAEAVEKTTAASAAVGPSKAAASTAAPKKIRAPRKKNAEAPVAGTSSSAAAGSSTQTVTASALTTTAAANTTAGATTTRPAPRPKGRNAPVPTSMEEALQVRTSVASIAAVAPDSSSAGAIGPIRISSLPLPPPPPPSPSPSSSSPLPPPPPPPPPSPASDAAGNITAPSSSKGKGKGRAQEEEEETDREVTDPGAESIKFSGGVKPYDAQQTRARAFAAYTAARFPIGVPILSSSGSSAIDNDEGYHSMTSTTGTPKMADEKGNLDEEVFQDMFDAFVDFEP